MSENLRRYTKSLYALDAVVRRVPTEKWDASSPCEGWTARHVLGHVLWGTDSIAAGLNGTEGPGQRDEAEAAGSDPVATWSTSLDTVFEALDKPGALQTVIDSPFGKQPIDDMLGFFFGDPVMHAWDIATAAGIPHGIPDDLADAVVTGLGAAGEMLRSPGLLGPEQPAPAGADGAARMAAFGGRVAPGGAA